MRDWTDWPTIATYLLWAEAAGCRVERGAEDPDPGGCRLARIVSSFGEAAVAFVEEDEPLTSTMAAHLDRRLGLKSRLFA